MDFSKFDNAVDLKAVEQAQANPNTGNTIETPAGNYMCVVENMELGATKDGRPMFKVMLRVTGCGEKASDEVDSYLAHFKNGKMPCLFMNRVLYGTKNDANMIASVTGWLSKLMTETQPVFKNYSQFADVVLDIFEELDGAVELDVNYDPNAFNSISINEVYDL